jgi:hypothetical protein
MAGPSPSPGPASKEGGFMGFLKKNKWFIAGGVGGLVLIIVLIMVMSGGNSSGYSDLSEF